MSKAQSKSSNKASSSSNKSSGASDRNIAAGGQVYDRTTGTWEGATQGSFGDGKDRGAGLNTKVWRDANGITGVEVIGPRSDTRASGNGGGGSGSARAGQSGGAGPGSPGVVTGSKGAAGGGAGASMVTIGGPVSGISAPLKSKLKPENTSFMSGGRPFVPHPGFSDAEEIEALMGDGDSPLEVAWYYKQYAALSHTGWDLGTRIGTAIGTAHNSLDNSWVEPDTPLFSPDYNWGR